MFQSACNSAYVVYTKTVFHLSVGGNANLVIGVLRHQFFACLLYLCHFIVVIFSPLKMYFIRVFEMMYHVLKCAFFQFCGATLQFFRKNIVFEIVVMGNLLVLSTCVESCQLICGRFDDRLKTSSSYLYSNEVKSSPSFSCTQIYHDTIFCAEKQRIVSASPFIHQSDRVERRTVPCQKKIENYPNFRRVLFGLFSGPRNRYKTAQCMR